MALHKKYSITRSQICENKTLEEMNFITTTLSPSVQKLCLTSNNDLKTKLVLDLFIF